MTQGASAFSAGTASSRKGQCSDLTRPFFADSHWEAELYQRLFLQLKKLRAGSSYPQGSRFQATSQDDSLFPYQSSFGELRMGPTLRDTLDTGLCCSSQGRGHRTIISKLQQCRGHVYYTNLQSTAPYGETVLTPGSYLQSLQWFPFIIRHITLMGKGWVSNAFDGWTNVFPDAW